MNMHIKNEQIKKAIAFENNRRVSKASILECADVMADMSPTDIVMNIMLGYISSLDEIAETPEIDLHLDLTYDTIKDFPTAVAYEFGAFEDTSSPFDNKVEIAIKTIASYLTFLAANEHGLEIIGEFCGDHNAPDTYSGLFALVGTINAREDFLAAAAGCVEFNGKDLEVYYSKIRDAYMRVTGVDLFVDYGLDDCCFTFGE